jgi:hypothetical protein
MREVFDNPICALRRVPVQACREVRKRALTVMRCPVYANRGLEILPLFPRHFCEM